MFSAAARPAASRCFLVRPCSTPRKMDCRAGVGSARGPSTHTVASPPGEEVASAGGWRREAVSLTEWQGWGSSSPVPAMVTKVVDDLMALERETDAEMTFGGLGGKIQGDFKVQEDKKHRAVYQSLIDSETKLQFFAARQIACRLLGSRGYLCQKVFPDVLAPNRRLYVFQVSAMLCVEWNAFLGIHASEGFSSTKQYWKAALASVRHSICIFMPLWYSRTRRNYVGCI